MKIENFSSKNPNGTMLKILLKNSLFPFITENQAIGINDLEYLEYVDVLGEYALRHHSRDLVNILRLPVGGGSAER